MCWPFSRRFHFRILVHVSGDVGTTPIKPNWVEQRHPNVNWFTWQTRLEITFEVITGFSRQPPWRIWRSSFMVCQYDYLEIVQELASIMDMPRGFHLKSFKISLLHKLLPSENLKWHEAIRFVGKTVFTVKIRDNTNFKTVYSRVIVKKSSPKNLSANCRSTVGRQLTDRLPTVYRQLTNRLPTG